MTYREEKLVYCPGIDKDANLKFAINNEQTVLNGNMISKNNLNAAADLGPPLKWTLVKHIISSSERNNSFEADVT